VSFNLGAWLSGFVASLSPRTLAYSATSAALAIMLLAAVTVGSLVDYSGQTTYGTVSLPADKTYAMVRFAPETSVADITKFLEANKATVVGGPRPGGMYKVLVADTKLPKDQAEALIKKLQTEGKIISFIAPSD
jgi:hypothetical protein